jgi:glycosyltransferase involved in cell wall biosynthesis
MLADVGERTAIALLEHDPHIAESVDSMRADGRLSVKVSVKTLFTYFAELIEQSGGESFRQFVGRTSEYVGATGLQIVRYRSLSGFIFAEEILDATKKVIQFSIILPNEKLKSFNSKFEAQAYWLELICKENLPATLIADPWRASHIVANVALNGVTKILTMHSNHLNPPYRFGAAVKASSMEVLDNLKCCHALVVLTKAQHRDLEQEYGYNPKIKVIGNPLTNFIDLGEVIRDPNLAVIVSRFDALKGIPRIVNNFKRVVELVPAARLEIWGAGADEQEIHDAISESGLASSVTVKGYSPNPSQQFRRARMSLAASEHEGFGLSFMESLSVGTPVISFRTNYGPEEIITHGIDGFVVDTDEQFVQHVSKLFHSPELFLSMNEAGPKNMQRFAHHHLASLWQDLLDCTPRLGSQDLLKDKPSKVIVDVERSSAYGHIFVRKDDLAQFKPSKVRVLEVNRTKKFRNSENLVGLGVYEVHDLRLEEDGDFYAFNLRHMSTIYNGTIPAMSMKIELIR